MSIKQLVEATPFSPRTKEFTVEIAGNPVTFIAKQLSYLDVLDLAVESRRDGMNRYALQVSKTITDPEGAHMTYEQATKLPDEIAKVFWDASIEVNAREDAEKK